MYEKRSVLEMCKNIKRICVKYDSFLTVFLFIIICIIICICLLLSSCSDYVNYELRINHLFMQICKRNIQYTI